MLRGRLEHHFRAGPTATRRRSRHEVRDRTRSTSVQFLTGRATNLLHALKLHCFIYCKLGLVDNEEACLVLMELYACVGQSCWRSPTRDRQESTPLPIPAVRIPHTYLKDRGSSIKRCKEWSWSKIWNGWSSMKHLITWASDPEETSTFNTLEKASPVIRLEWPFSLLLTYNKYKMTKQKPSYLELSDHQTTVSIIPHRHGHYISE